MNRIAAAVILILFTASPLMASRFTFPGDKTEDQKKRERRERYEERYQKKLDYLYLQDIEDLNEYKREKRKLKLKKLERKLEDDVRHPDRELPPEGLRLKE